MLDENNMLLKLMAFPWIKLLKNYDDVVNMIKALCLKLTDKQLNQIVDMKMVTKQRFVGGFGT
jgi:hypothetical protein